MSLIERAFKLGLVALILAGMAMVGSSVKGPSVARAHAQVQDPRLANSLTLSQVRIGRNTPAQGADFWAGQNYREEAGWHAFEDENKIENHGGHGYASFDAMPTMLGTGPYDHFVGFQSRPIYKSSGDLATYFSAVDTFSVHSGSGTVAVADGVHIRDVGGAGPIDANYGLRIEAITRGSKNYAIYSAGGAVYLAGRTYLGSGLMCDSIFQNTEDGSDKHYLSLAGGGGTVHGGVGRGALMNLFGNEHDAHPGDAVIVSGTGNGVNYGDLLFWGGGTEYLRVDGNLGNLGLGQAAFGTSAARVFAQGTGAAPTTSPADSYQLYSADAGNVAGQAGPHFRTEGGGIFGLRSDTGTTLQYVYQRDDLPDGGTVALPAGTSGMVLVSCNAEAGMWLVQRDGTVTKISGSVNTAANDVAGNLCLFGKGTSVAVRNRLGGIGEIRIIYFYN